MNGAFQGTALGQGGGDIVPGAPAGALYLGQGNNNYFRSIENVNETTITSNLAEEFLNAADDDFGGGRQAKKREDAAGLMGQREYFHDTQQSNARLNPFLSQNNMAFQSTGL